MTPNQEGYCCLAFLPCNTVFSVSLKGLFELTLNPSRAVSLASCIAFGTVNHGDYQVCLARCSGPRTPSKTPNTNLDSVFVKKTLLYNDP